MYKRVLIKISGESLSDKDNHQTLNTVKLSHLAKIFKELHEKGIQIGIVVGAGNIWRGKFANLLNIDPVEADFMGMTGTIINAVAISSALKQLGVPSKVYSAINIDPITLPFDEKNVQKDIVDNVLVFGGGLGKPFYTTDTASSLRAIQIDADVILMGKNGCDGVYDSDPNSNPNAKKYDILTFQEILDKKLGVMDLSAAELLKDKDIEIKVFSMDNVENIIKVVSGDNIGTTIRRNK